MTFRITGLEPNQFGHLFGLADEALAERGVIRRIADRPGFPCRITLEDAAPGDRVLLLNYESHDASTPYRSSYAIFVKEGARHQATFQDDIPPVMRNRPIALRHFDKDGILVSASLALNDDVREAINRAFSDGAVAYIHAHNAAHGCFAAKVERA